MAVCARGAADVCAVCLVQYLFVLNVVAGGHTVKADEAGWPCCGPVCHGTTAQGMLEA